MVDFNKHLKKNAIVPHSERKHALLSASGSSRWMNCTASARLEEMYGEQTTSVYADEGTTAHELGEALILRDVMMAISEDDFNVRLEEIMNKPTFNDEMFEEVPKYVDYVLQQFQEAKTRTHDAVIAIEQKVDFSDYIPEGFGSCDTVIIADGIMEVTDLKYGKGIPVYADNNSQLKLYGLGALRKFEMMYDITTVRLSIVQPRINNISFWDISVEDLINWAETELTEKATAAFAGEGDLTVGDWCRFCSVKNRCKALSQQNLEMAQFEFKEPTLLTDNEIAEILKKTPRLVEWANSISDYALTKAVTESKHFPGFKLVEGVARRKWIDEDIAAKAITDRLPGFEDSDIFNLKLKSLTDIEKKLGKKDFADKLGDIVIKPQGKPTLVSELDKRPAIGIDQAKLDFAD